MPHSSIICPCQKKYHLVTYISDSSCIPGKTGLNRPLYKRSNLYFCPRVSIPIRRLSNTRLPLTLMSVSFRVHEDWNLLDFHFKQNRIMHLDVIR